MGKGDRIIIETPGAGAWGAPENDQDFAELEVKRERETEKLWEARGSLADRAAAQAAF